MTEIQLPGSLLPSHLDIHPNIQYIREKYDLPEI